MGGPLYLPVKSGIHMLAGNTALYCPGQDQETQLLSPCVCGPLSDLAFEKFCSPHSKDGILLASFNRPCAGILCKMQLTGTVKQTLSATTS